MNRYPMVFAPRSWRPALHPWVVDFLRPLRKRQIEREVKLHRIDVQGIEHLRTALDQGQQIMIAPNHPFAAAVAQRLNSAKPWRSQPPKVETRPADKQKLSSRLCLN